MSATRAFLLNGLPELSEYESLGDWIEWADACGFLLRVYPDDSEHELVAAAIVRPLTKKQLDKGYDAFVHDENGELLYIDICVALTQEALRGLGLSILGRFGEREAIAFNSHKRGIRIHDWNKSRKSIFKLRNQP